MFYIIRQMILVSTPSKPFTYTAKSTARRQAIINDYADEIEALYTAIDETTQSHILPPSAWTHDETLNFVRAVVTKVLKRSIEDTDDIFQHGCDR